MIIEYENLHKIRTENNKKIGLFKGTFDLFHCSHLACLNEIKSRVDILVVEIKNDKDVRKKKGNNRPIIPEGQRALIVDNIKAVDYTIIANEEKTTEIIRNQTLKYDYTESEIYKIKRDGYVIEKLKPDYVFTTNEKPVSKIIMDLCDELHIEIKIIPVHDGPHTTEIIQKCKMS